jgi:hypothetical protein
MRVQFDVEGTVLEASLDDTQAARDLVAQLPLTLPFEDYGGNEKIAYPPEELSNDEPPVDANVETGDLAYYVPWGDIIVFYADGGPYSESLIRLGRFDGDITAFTDQDATFTVTIESVE